MIVAVGKGLDVNVAGEVGWGVKGQLEAIAGIEEGSVGVVEGEEPRTNLVKWWRGGGEGSAKGVRLEVAAA